MTSENTRGRFAIVTGASSGIGLQLARDCAEQGFDLLIAADEPLEEAAAQLRAMAGDVQSIQVDLSTTEGVDRLYAATERRSVDALLANAGRGWGHEFLDQYFAETAW